MYFEGEIIPALLVELALPQSHSNKKHCVAGTETKRPMEENGVLRNKIYPWEPNM